MEQIKIAGRYLKYFASAKTRYQIHSPFVFDLINEVYEDDRNYYAFDKAEILREALMRNDTEIEVTDFGAGSHNNKSPKRKISNIATNALSPPAQCAFLFRLINRYRPKTMIEIGTSLGIATLYQAFGNKNAALITLEGCPKIAGIAQRQFKKAKAQNIEVIVGNFDQTLETALKKVGTLDYIFIDGNHRKAPTIQYYEQALQYAHDDTIFVFDDIHWSEEMEAAWQEVTNRNEVTIALDFFFFGLVFLKKANAKKINEVIVKSVLKPWKMGFFK